MFFLDGVRNFGGLTEEIEVLANRGSRRASRVSKRVIVEGIVGLFELVA